ncbi:MAG: hypothetical protein ABI562_01410 [Chloroflexota bacterium]
MTRTNDRWGQMMRGTPRRGVAIILALAVLATIGVAPASAITTQRTWTAKLGSSVPFGSIALRAYTNGVGSISYSLKNLRGNATYGVQIRNGSCASLGTIVARPNPVRTSATGTASQADIVYPAMMSNIWLAARRPSFAVRILNGTSIKCANFSFKRATRVAVPALGIDLPVIRGSGYPLCRVALYLPSLAQPREPGITFIYAHARTGMFLPLLTRSKINGGASMIGMTVKVWTSDSRVVYYRINRVRRNVTTMAGAFTLTSERLWLQTSTGPNYRYPKLVVEAYRYKTLVSSYAAAHPRPRPYRC